MRVHVQGIKKRFSRNELFRKVTNRIYYTEFREKKNKTRSSLTFKVKIGNLGFVNFELPKG